MERTSSFKRKAASQVPSDKQHPGLVDHTGAPLEGSAGSARQRTASRTAAQPRVPPKLQGSTKQMTQRDWKVSISQAVSCRGHLAWTTRLLFVKRAVVASW